MSSDPIRSRTDSPSLAWIYWCPRPSSILARRVRLVAESSAIRMCSVRRRSLSQCRVTRSGTPASTASSASATSAGTKGPVRYAAIPRLRHRVALSA